jgi:hypothetical protein
MEDAEIKCRSIDEFPSDSTLQDQLQIQWQDHIQTRNQTWKSLQIQVAIFLAVIGSDIKLDDPMLLAPLGLILLLTTGFGVAATLHHRKAQIKKFQYIYLFEEKLELLNPGYMTGIYYPREFKWRTAFSIKEIATPTFILTMHLMILVFGVMYIALRLIGIIVGPS